MRDSEQQLETIAEHADSRARDPEEQLETIAEYADSSVRVLFRQGSLVGVPGAYGLKRWLYARWGNRGNAAYTFVGSLLAVGLSGVAAWAFDEPLLFPSLGATAFLFFETPMAEVASPRNAIIGHFVAILAAMASPHSVSSTPPAPTRAASSRRGSVRSRLRSRSPVDC